MATVLGGELAEQQSIFIMRALREMRHYIKQNLCAINKIENMVMIHQVIDGLLLGTDKSV